MDPETLKELVKVKMPFGKYQGRYLVDLPYGYVSWFRNKGFPQGKIGEWLALLCQLQEDGLDTYLRQVRDKLEEMGDR